MYVRPMRNSKYRKTRESPLVACPQARGKERSSTNPTENTKNKAIGYPNKDPLLPFLLRQLTYTMSSGVVDSCEVKSAESKSTEVKQASPLENRTSILSSLKRDCKGIQHSSPLVEKPARPLVAAALHSALLALHSTRLQTSESRHARSLTRGAGIGTSTSTERLRDAAKGVVGEVGLRGGTAGAAEAARGALFGGLEAFFDGEELGFESGGERVSEKIPWSMRWCLSGRTYLWLATMSFS